MRKFTFIAALAFCAMGANAQTVEFVRDGQVLEDGAIVSVTDTIVTYIGEYQGKIFISYQLDAEILVRNSGSESQNASLTINVKDGKSVGYCGFGTTTCTFVEVGAPVKRTTDIPAGIVVNPDVHFGPYDIIDGNFNQTPINSVIEYKLEYGSTTKTVTVNFNYDPSTAINSVNANANIFQSGNELNYSFDKVGNHQLNVYNVTGSLVKKQALETAGTVALDNLNKGVYIYEVTENGKRIAAHKCVIR